MTLQSKLLLIIITISLNYSCEKKPVAPVINTNTVTDITTTTAVSGGEISDDGGSPIISKGVCWDVSYDPTIENNKLSDNTNSTSFTCNLVNLAPGTLYYTRAYATNSVGTSYGESGIFKTLGDKPAFQDKNVSNITINSATLIGNVNPNLLSTSVAFEWGPSSAYGNTISATGSPLNGSTSSDFSAELTGLTPGTTYHFRVKATNELGSIYSDNMQFTTLGQVPATIAMNATNLQLRAVTINGSVNPNHLLSTVIFEWGTTISYGNRITPVPGSVSGGNPVNLSVDLTGLTPGTTYHFRFSSTNELGTSNSSDKIFRTLGDVPSAMLGSASNLQYNSASVSGQINPNNFQTDVMLEYGTTTAYGNTLSVLQSPFTGSNSVNIVADLSGLIQGTSYHIRIKAVNELGTTFSNDFTFTTLAPISDIEGNTYNIKTIGSQIWMTENLKATKYNNGDLIGTTSSLTLDISNENMPKYQWAYEGNESYAAIYGRLYTGYAANDPRKVCPSGWHIPSDEEWTTLTNYLINNGYGYGGSGDDIGKSLAATSLWAFNSIPGNVGNDPATNNKSGFSALPAGYRSANDNVDGIFVSMNWICSWWSSTDVTDNISRQRILQNQFNFVSRSYLGGKRNGISVRCIKD